MKCVALMTQYDGYLLTNKTRHPSDFTLATKRRFWVTYGWALLGILVVCLLGGLGGYFLYIKSGLHKENRHTQEIPLIHSQGPFKEKPTDPGGSKVLHQDKEIYTSLLDGRLNKNEGETHLGELPETPLFVEEEIVSPPAPLISVSESEVLVTPLPKTPSPQEIPPSASSLPAKPNPLSDISKTNPPLCKPAPAPAPAPKPTRPLTSSSFSLRLVRCATKAICQKELHQFVRTQPKIFSKIPLAMEREKNGKLMLCVGPFPSEKKALATQTILVKQGIASTVLTNGSSEHKP